jgi:hypothetical protein
MQARTEPEPSQTARSEANTMRTGKRERDRLVELVRQSLSPRPLNRSRSGRELARGA